MRRVPCVVLGLILFAAVPRGATASTVECCDDFTGSSFGGCGFEYVDGPVGFAASLCSSNFAGTYSPGVCADPCGPAQFCCAGVTNTICGSVPTAAFTIFGSDAGSWPSICTGICGGTVQPGRCTPCGDGTVDAGEECDDGNTNAGDGCTSACTICGNGTTTPPEQCDDANLVDGDGCDSNCTLPGCGNDVVDAGETCDDGNLAACDGCSVTCTIESCGNGVTECAEQCDDGNTTACDGCSATCRTEVCGNGIVECGEQCDDGNTADGDCCSSTCQADPPTTSCAADGDVCTVDRCNGAGHCATVAIVPGCVPPAECCEPSQLFGECGLEFRQGLSPIDFDGLCNGTFSTGTCNITCGPAVACCSGVTSSSCGGVGASIGIYGSIGSWGSICGFCGGTLSSGRCLSTPCGDGTLDPGEECDDGNGDASDGCTGACTTCGNNTVTAPEQCDDGNLVDGDGCDSNCTLPACGNGILGAGEACDDGNTTACDGCSATCTIESCGNGTAECGEQCDDGNTTPCDGCSATCRTEACGNGVVECTEQCDDGNTANGDCCSGTCAADPAGGSCNVDLDACTADECDGSGFCVFIGRAAGCEGPFGDPTCTNSLDDDGDTTVDVQDPDCTPPVEGPPGNPRCTNGLDDDGDGLVDGADAGCQDPCTPETCNGVDDDCDSQIDEGFSDRDGDGIADCVDQDQDNDGLLDGADNCPTAFNPPQTDGDGDGLGDACDGDVPPITNPPTTAPITIDGQFGPSVWEWRDVTPASFQNGQAKVYTAVDPAARAIFLLYDFAYSTTPLAVGEESGQVSFQVGGAGFFDVFFIQGGENTNFAAGTAFSGGGAGDRVRVLFNGRPFDGAGCMTGAVDFNSTSDAFPGVPHNLFELRVGLVGSPGGCYSSEPAFWSASLPGVAPIVPLPGPFANLLAAMPSGSSIFTVSETFVEVAPDGSTTITPTVEGPPGDPTCSDGVDNDGDGNVDAADPDCATPLGQFTCHKVTAFPRFPAVSGIELVDQFETTTVIAKKPATLCAPADPAQADHLTSYQLKVPPFVAVRNLTVTDQFGSLQLDAVKLDRLLVPSAKSLIAPPAAPATPGIDHFSCYRVKKSKDAVAFVPVPSVVVTDQLGTFVVDLKKPQSLCAPADKNGESPGAETHADHLLCYKVKAPKMAKLTPVYAADQLGSLTLTLSSIEEVCFPATKQLGP